MHFSTPTLGALPTYPRQADAPDGCVCDLSGGLRLAGVALLGLLAANCAGPVQQASTVDQKYGVPASPRVVEIGDAVPKGGGRVTVGKPYTVAGQVYTPVVDPEYSATGTASWYGEAFHGRLTANGEVFDKESVAAAHPTLPLPSYARITNLRNRRSMIVRVNDRGPYHADRLIDVSERVAQSLDFKRFGTAHVRVDYMREASLRGSDDQKLSATLRTDGRPAGLPGARPTQVSASGGGDRSDGFAHTGFPLPPQRPFHLGTVPRPGLPLGSAVRRADTEGRVAVTAGIGPLDRVPQHFAPVPRRAAL